MGNFALVGKDRDTWGTSEEPLSRHMDLLTIKSNIENDVFSTWFSRKFIHWFHHILWHRIKKADDAESGIVSYEDKTLQKYTSHITTIIASSLPILAIVVLYCVEAMNARLGLTTLFTVVFAVCLSFFTNGTKGDTFIATSTWVLSVRVIV
jgi:type IV secretory pathway VirB2 component (pilin)